MSFNAVRVKPGLVLPALLAIPCGAGAGEPPGPGAPAGLIEIGRRIYEEGRVASGAPVQGTAFTDVVMTGDQARCTACHRRSGLGSMEGQEAVPAVTGDILYQPLRLPTSGPPLAPLLRPAYTDETLARAIRTGIGADGRPLGALMPRYSLGDNELAAVIAYLQSLESSPAPGVTERELHLATIVSEGVDPAARRAFLDVMEHFVEQRNRETRYEGDRAEHAPWHKAWRFESYRKWVLHVWDLTGPPAGWSGQLRQAYADQEVFAVISGLVPGSFEPVHDFCEAERLPCIFPITALPAIAEDDFYNIYFSRGMALEADAVLAHLAGDGLTGHPIVQVYAPDDPRARMAAARLREAVVSRGGRVIDRQVDDPRPSADAPSWPAAEEAREAILVLWSGAAAGGAGIWPPSAGQDPQRIYLSATLSKADPGDIPPALRARTFVVHPHEPPGPGRKRLVARAAGWLRAKGISVPGQTVVQANALFALKLAGEAVKGLRGFFNREHFIERIEHIIDNTTYTSVYPSMTLAPGQRFASKGAGITPLAPAGAEGVQGTKEWMLVPGD